MIKNTLSLALIFISFSAFSGNSGTIHFSGSVVDSACEMGNTANDYGCQKDIALKNSKEKEDRKKANLENIVNIKNFPIKDGESKVFNVEGNKVTVTKKYNEKYSKLYFIDIEVK